MLEALLVVLILVAAVVAALLVLAVGELRRERPVQGLDAGPTFAELVRDRVAVHLLNEQTLEGVVVAEYPEAIALAHGVALMSDGSAHALEGETVIERRRIAFVQRLSVPSSKPSAPARERDEALS